MFFKQEEKRQPPKIKDNTNVSAILNYEQAIADQITEMNIHQTFILKIIYSKFLTEEDKRNIAETTLLSVH